MDSEPRAEPNFDTASAIPATPAETAAPANEGAASVSAGAAEKREMEAVKQDSAKPNTEVPPIPSSALVILPPSVRRFDAEPEKKKAGHSKWLRSVSRAAAAVLLLGCAFAAGGRFLGSVRLGQHAVVPRQIAVAAPHVAPQQAIQAAAAPTGATPSDQIQAIEARLDSLAAAMKVKSPDEIRDLKKSIEGLRANFEAEKAQTDAAVARLSAKLDQLQREESRIAALDKTEHAQAGAADPKAIQATLDRVARGEKPSPLTTASIPASGAAGALKPQRLAMSEPQKKPQQVLSDWVVRDVYDGIALVEGPMGAVEVMPGDMLPGAGVVKSIERRDGGWVVVTSHGLVEYAGD